MGEKDSARLDATQMGLGGSLLRRQHTDTLKDSRVTAVNHEHLKSCVSPNSELRDCVLFLEAVSILILNDAAHVGPLDSFFHVEKRDFNPMMTPIVELKNSFHKNMEEIQESTCINKTQVQKGNHIKSFAQVVIGSCENICDIPLNQFRRP